MAEHQFDKKSNALKKLLFISAIFARSSLVQGDEYTYRPNC